jgi:hypothetical protein
VLGGFVIRHFLGGWTLVTKTLGLVSVVDASCLHLLTIIVSCSSLRIVARQGGTVGSCSMLLSQSVYEAVWQCEWQ